MNSKPQIALLLICLFTQVLSAQTNCADAYTAASYGLSHGKKSFKANNFDHQQYYAGRALDAFEKTRELVNSCGCDRALVSIASGIENLEKALDPKDWDMGRYFTKRAIADAYAVLENLDICSTANDSEASVDNGNTTFTPEQDEEHIKALRTLESATLSEFKQLEQTVQKLSELLDCDAPQFSMDQLRQKYNATSYSDSLEELQARFIEDMQTMYQKALEKIEACRENM